MGNTMTALRWRRKPCRRDPTAWVAAWAAVAWRTGAAVLLAAAVWGSLGLVSRSRAAVPIVVDPISGLAISGFDPVAYFTDGQALQGKGEFEQAFAGTAWRFRSAGNRAAFVADPGVYMPRFGGYDPMGISRGVVVAGNPRLWLIHAQRLYFFYMTETQEEFREDGDRAVATADGEWPHIQLKIEP